MFYTHPVPSTLAKQAFVDSHLYQSMYQSSLDNPEQFWAEQADLYVSWFQPWRRVLQGDFYNADVRWYEGAKLNVCYNCVDRHLPQRAQQTALIWEGDEPDQSRRLTYAELYEDVCRLANVLKSRGVKKGDRVCIYIPMIPEAAIAMLACARIGAIHSVVFGGFSAEALHSRVVDADCKCIITADHTLRGGKVLPLKANVDQALAQYSAVHSVIVVKYSGQSIPWQKDRDIWYHEALAEASVDCPPEVMDADDPLFILYTSGSTGKPKGVVHTQAGYLVYVAMTFKLVFDYHEGEIYWCTADVGWITGHSYILYGPLANGAISLMFAGVPTYPSPARFWQVVDKYQVNIFYTAPTAIRSLMREGDAPVKSTQRKSLKLLASVGEPINPEVWEWYYKVVGEERCPVIDTWWQTETGGFMITPLPGAALLKAGSATRPFFGIAPAIVDEKGYLIEGETSGSLVITRPWPGMMRTLFGDHQRYIDNYFRRYPGMYFTGDGAHRDVDGYYWITGRIDDVLNVSGHRLGTAEIESAIVAHPKIAEAAVVGYPHPIKGQGIYAFVTPMAGITPDDALRQEVIEEVRKQIGAIAVPDVIQWTNALPKTRSGKIMRRILTKIVSGQTDDLGDTSTLADPEVLQDLISKIKRNPK